MRGRHGITYHVCRITNFHPLRQARPYHLTQGATIESILRFARQFDERAPVPVFAYFVYSAVNPVSQQIWAFATSSLT